MTEVGRLARLCELLGIERGYRGVDGAQHALGAASMRALVAAIGADPDADPDALRAERQATRLRRLLPPVAVLCEDRLPHAVPLTLPPTLHDARLCWSLRLESGEEQDGALAADRLEAAPDEDGLPVRLLPLPALPAGYHRLSLHAEGVEAQLPLLVAPARCEPPPAGERGCFGLAVQLYALRSRGNWGCGDLGDLQALAGVAGALGADFIGVNPLHALFPEQPARASPYSPSSRRFLNPLYLRVEAVADFAHCEAAREQVADAGFQARLRAARATALVDWPAVAALKLPVLERLWQHFRDHALASGDQRGRDYRRFVAEGGEALRHQALYESLQARFHAEDAGVRGWQDWPAPFRDPASARVADFAREQEDELGFRCYLQWQTTLQLDAAAAACRAAGMLIGLYRDLAVGVDPGGADAWAEQALYVAGARIGAPPDEFNPVGQDWGLPPLHPGRLREQGHEAFVQALRANMRAAGALRIDHVMALAHLYWVPAGGAAADGGYVRYALDELLGVVALESRRAGCLVVGEDLGTVPDGLRERLAERGLLSCRILAFERDQHGGYRPPSDYPEAALVATGNHDLPPLAAWWQGDDIDRRERLGLYPKPRHREQAVVQRARDVAQLLIALEREGLLPEHIPAHAAGAALTPALAQAMHAYIAATPCRLMAVQPEDVFGQVEQVNLPGTVDQHPNWRRKLPLALEAWGDDEAMQTMTARLRAVRGGPAAAPAAAPLPSANAIPRATYRLQLNRDFGFADAAALVPYLHELGISHCYLSPYLCARAGSQHGYDVVDHAHINPELGSEADFRRFTDTLAAHGMGHILDTVPNHMGVMGADNRYWLDVLENGPASEFAHWFDIDWQPRKDELRGKVLVPVLGGPYGEVLGRGELVLTLDAEAGALHVAYWGHRFPLDPQTYPHVLGARLDELAARMGEEHPLLLEYQSLVTACERLPPRGERSPARLSDRRRDKELAKHRLAALLRRSPDVALFVAENVAACAAPGGAEALHELLERQAYRLAFWRVAADDINYRRFFDVNDLAALRMESEAVFAATHARILEWLREGRLQGLRIDHPDGLNDPAGYFRRLQRAFADEHHPRPLYVVVEKILESFERLPESWMVHGTSGYDFGNEVLGLFVDADNEAAVTAAWHELSGLRTEFEEEARRCKQLIMRTALSSELAVLANRLSVIAESDRYTRDYTASALRDALFETIACFPVYRTYVGGEGASEDDRRHIDWAVGVARKQSVAADLGVFDFVRGVLLTDIAASKPEDYRAAVLDFAKKFQQYTGPVMAKGVEDTAFYRWNRLTALNEVGGSPARFGVSPAAFHHQNQQRARQWPHAMLTTSTHDSKRSEDVRTRIVAISELADDWREAARRWRVLNRRHKRELDESRRAPADDDEHLLYQTLLGTWPGGMPDAAALAAYRDRIEGYMTKALREAKRHTSWVHPDADYEQAVADFVRGALEPGESNLFLADFVPFAERVAHVGRLSSLSQTLLKLTAPGVPDIYQGNELFEYALVDPDNRRPVDYERRRALLASLGDSPAPEALLRELSDGRAKLAVTRCALRLRAEREALFRLGEYEPVTVTGERAAHLCAFLRRHESGVVLVVAPRLIAGLLGEDHGTALPVDRAAWGDTVLEGVDEGAWTERLTGARVKVRGGRLAVANLLARFPVALALRE